MKRLPLVPKSEGILLNRNEVMRARKAQQAVHWARKRASPGKLRNPDEDRIVLIEDTSEIHLEKPNLVRFEARQAQPDLPAITTRDLLKPSLRHRPDRIILGEIRAARRSICSSYVFLDRRTKDLSQICPKSGTCQPM